MSPTTILFISLLLNINGIYSYFVGPTKLTFQAAQAYCVRNGANLASITSAKEQADAQATCATKGSAKSEGCWCGLNDRNREGSFRFIDGKSFGGSSYTNWYPGEPNNVGNEDCVELAFGQGWNGKWNDHQCSVSKYPLCNDRSANLKCPAGTRQVGNINADVPGCGLQSCDKRYDLNTIEQCRDRCKAHKDCKSITWAPLNGDRNHQGKKVCTIYRQSAPTSTFSPNQIFCYVSKPPTRRPTARPTRKPTAKPTRRPTAKPTRRPTAKPTAKPTRRGGNFKSDPCYGDPDGICGAGYMDKTNGNSKLWACGRKCKVGYQRTDGVCNCACIPEAPCPFTPSCAELDPTASKKCSYDNKRNCYDIDIKPKVGQRTEKRVIIASTETGKDSYFDVSFTAVGADCIDPEITFSFELIDYNSGSEYLQIYDGDKLMKTCQGGKQNDCGVCSECLTDFDLRANIIPSGQTYKITVFESRAVNSLACNSRKYSTYAEVLLTCQVDRSDQARFPPYIVHEPEYPLQSPNTRPLLSFDEYKDILIILLFIMLVMIMLYFVYKTNFSRSKKGAYRKVVGIDTDDVESEAEMSALK